MGLLVPMLAIRRSPGLQGDLGHEVATRRGRLPRRCAPVRVHDIKRRAKKASPMKIEDLKSRVANIVNADAAPKADAADLQLLDDNMLDAVSGGREWWVQATWTMRF